MKQKIFMLAVLFLPMFSSGCYENGLECDENKFVDRCVDNYQYLEICTYGEKAKVRCPFGCSTGEDKDECASE